MYGLRKRDAARRPLSVALPRAVLLVSAASGSRLENANSDEAGARQGSET